MVPCTATDIDFGYLIVMVVWDIQRNIRVSSHGDRAYQGGEI